MEKKVKFHTACHIFHARCLGYIQTIRSMEESVQHVVMTAIQHLLTNCTPATPVTSSREVEELQEEVDNCKVIFSYKSKIQLCVDK